MKNAIRYYYGLSANDIRLFNKNYYFFDKFQYVLYEYDRNPSDIDDIYNLSMELISKNIFCHQLIVNKDKKLITNINGNLYVLLKVFIENRAINFNDVVLFNQINIMGNYEKLRRDNWFRLWCDNVDYFEYQISEFGKKYRLVNESFSYFIGLTETGISLCRKQHSITLSNKRLKYNDTLFDLYNPINFIIDVRGRNICEFFKSCFFNNINLVNEVKTYILKLNSEEMYMFFVRLFYPSFYFDNFQKIINKEVSDNVLKKTISKIDEYQNMVTSMYYFLKKYINLPEVEWIQKNRL